MKNHFLLTVDMDDWYDIGFIAGRKGAKSSIDVGEYEGEGLEEPTYRILRLFNKYNIKGTFFIQGIMVKKYKGLVKEINRDGHEIASHDWDHNSPKLFSKKEFKERIVKSKNVIKKTVGKYPVGYRVPNLEFYPWIFPILKEQGFHYDSSIYPILPIPGFYGYPRAPLRPYRMDFRNIQKEDPKSDFFEIPMAAIPVVRLAVGSSWYTRNLGLGYVKLGLKQLMSRYHVATYFFHPYEISNKLPKIKGLPNHAFRNTGDKYYGMVESIIKSFKESQFTSCSDYLTATKSA